MKKLTETEALLYIQQLIDEMLYKDAKNLYQCRYLLDAIMFVRGGRDAMDVHSMGITVVRDKEAADG